MATETAPEQVPQTPSYEDQLTPEQRQRLDAFKEIVFAGIRWGGWKLDRSGNDMATLAVVYAVEPNRPLGFNKKVSVPSVTSDDEHRKALSDGVVTLVEEFVAANLGVPSIDILSASDDPIWDQSPVTGFGRVMEALAAPGSLPPDFTIEEETVPTALADLNRENVEAETMVREFGTPTPSWMDVIKDRLMRRM